MGTGDGSSMCKTEKDGAQFQQISWHNTCHLVPLDNTKSFKIYLPTWTQKSPRIVPGLESNGLVSPSISLPVLITFRPSHTLKKKKTHSDYQILAADKLYHLQEQGAVHHGTNLHLNICHSETYFISNSSLRFLKHLLTWSPSVQSPSSPRVGRE